MQGIKLKVKTEDDGWFSHSDIDYLYKQFNSVPVRQNEAAPITLVIHGSRSRAQATQ